MVIIVKKLGLAAYVKMQGGKLIRVGKDGYSFEYDRSAKEAEIEYLNSCCYEHDQQVMSLRALKETNYG